MVTNNNGRMSATTANPGAMPPEERSDWPEYLPPFLANAAQVAPNGQLWVQQAVASDDTAPTYDIFDASGKLTGRVVLPKGVAWSGCSARCYVARADETIAVFSGSLQ